ncbi:Stomatal closure-related actin-binding protein [Vigna unguiculata]|uniref:Stomatal closure-related actin-binding protein n=1 Tax=Vigna unguiculata TaxID=3917 RepID=A0A4D6LCC3_VIGUN|nr:Stomatal closure-related actin-binding protein [Vigna unguiculata]
MDMEHELRALRAQLAEKTRHGIVYHLMVQKKNLYQEQPNQFTPLRLLMLDVYCKADVISESEHLTLSTAGPIDPVAGLGTYVEALVRKHDTKFNLCGVRGGGNATTQGVFWQPKQGHSFVLAFESERERNAAIMLARRFAFNCNMTELI